MQEMVYAASTCSGSYSHSTDPYELFMCGSISVITYYKYTRFYGQLRYANMYYGGGLNFCAMGIELFDPLYTFVPNISGGIIICTHFILVLILAY